MKLRHLMNSFFLACTLGVGAAQADEVDNLLRPAQSEILHFENSLFLMCSSLSGIQRMYAAVLTKSDIGSIRRCWKVDRPVQIMVLHGGPRFSSITFRTYTTDEMIQNAINNGASEEDIQRRRDNRWSEWYQSPAWVFTEWLAPEE